MKIVILGIVLTAAAYGSGWTFLADIPTDVRVAGLHSDSTGQYIVEYEENLIDSIVYKELVIDTDGNVEILEAEHSPTPNTSGEDMFVKFPYPEDFEDDDTFAGISRISAIGDTLWSVPLDSIEGRKVVCLPVVPCEGGGCFAAFGPDYDFIWKIYRLDDNGEVLMSSEFQMQGGPVIRVSCTLETNDSSYLITGTTDDLGCNLFMYLIGINSDGDQFINVREDFRFHAAAELMELDDAGNIYIAGYTGFERPDGWFLPPYDSDVFLMKLDSDGNEIWRTVFDYPAENRPSVMHIDEDGSIAVVISSFSYEPSGQARNYSLMLYQHE